MNNGFGRFNREITTKSFKIVERKSKVDLIFIFTKTTYDEGHTLFNLE